MASAAKGDHTRYWCATCADAYPIEVGALLPDACPKGLRADDPELVEGAARASDRRGRWPGGRGGSGLTTAHGAPRAGRRKAVYLVAGGSS